MVTEHDAQLSAFGGADARCRALERSWRAGRPIEADAVLTGQCEAIIAGFARSTHVPVRLANAVDATRAFAEGVRRAAGVPQVRRMNADPVLALETVGTGGGAGLAQRRPDLAHAGRGLGSGHANQLALTAAHVRGA